MFIKKNDHPIFTQIFELPKWLLGEIKWTWFHISFHFVGQGFENIDNLMRDFEQDSYERIYMDILTQSHPMKQ